MARSQLKHIAVSVDITTMSFFNGMPHSIFHPNNPFLLRNIYQPLPYYGNSNLNVGTYKREVNWLIEEELTIDIPSLDLKKAFNCFNQISSVGARYSIKLCADVPNNSSPLELPPKTGSDTGHSFVVVTKSNGTKSVVQVFGFYAQSHPGYLFPWRSMPSTIKNNQLREINASIEVSLTEKQFELLRQKAFELAKNKYAAASYNCTNYGVDLFNSVRTKPITIETFTVLLPVNPTGPNLVELNKTPQMLFKKLKEMKDKKDVEASNIQIDQTNKTKAPLSHGECN